MYPITPLPKGPFDEEFFFFSKMAVESGISLSRFLEVGVIVEVYNGSYRDDN